MPQEAYMGLVNMTDMLKDAQQRHYAVGAFNIVNFQTARAVLESAERLNSPVILQTSVSTVEAIGQVPLIAFLRQLGSQVNVPVAIHLDHCTKLDFALQCADLGWTSVMVDFSKKSFVENMKNTKIAVDHCHAIGVSVEGELGAIFGVEDNIVVDEREASLADPDNSLEYCDATGIDAFAPAIGTAHGLYKGIPKVEFGLLKKISESIPCPAVVHGGTGLTADAFRECIQNGATKINISTAVKIAYCQAMAAYMQTHQNENNPLKLDAAAVKAVSDIVSEHMYIFGSALKAN